QECAGNHSENGRRETAGYYRKLAAIATQASGQDKSNSAFGAEFCQPRIARETLALRACELRVAEAVDRVVVYHANGLHEGVADGGADEAEATLVHVFAHDVRFFCFGVDPLARSPASLLRAAAPVRLIVD